MNIQIYDTKLLYAFDPLNFNNLHKYVDNISQVVLVIRLVNGYCLAGYYEGAFKPRQMSDKEGLIISLTNQKYFTTLERNRKATVYDGYYIIFGNSEIRLKSNEHKLFSNFGHNNSFYECNGNNISVLLGGGDKEQEIELVSYEFYQLLF